MDVYDVIRPLALVQMLLVGLLSSLPVSADGVVAGAPAVAPKAEEVYRVSSITPSSIARSAPQLPDLKPYTAAAVAARIVRKPVGTVSLRRMLGQNQLVEFTGGDERLREWVKRQGEMPQVVFIDGGYVTPVDLARSLPEKYFQQTAPGIYVLRLPIVVSQGATLHIGKETKEFRLSSEHGAFLINDGKLFITDTRLVSWRESENQQDWFRDKSYFRPFINAWGSTQTYISNSQIESLGYDASKSYGVSISQYSPAMSPIMKRGHPNAWVLDSHFNDMWFGFYCYEAYDVVIKGNTYRNSQVYGIDPHDRSRRLIIAENTTYGTKKKHGIIVSREVNDSWIFNNRSYENHLSGIVVDRSSVNNVLANNEVYRNGSDGITLYESDKNLLWGNKAFANSRHGIRVRNSLDTDLYENLAVGNGLLGIYGHIKDLTGTPRDFQLDPYTMVMSMTVVGGSLIGNTSGAISVVSPRRLRLYQVQMLMPTKPTGVGMFGALAAGKTEILDLLVRQKKAVQLLPVDVLAQREQ